MDPYRNMVAVVDREREFFGDSFIMQLYCKDPISTGKIAIVEQITMRSLDACQCIPQDLKPLHLSTEGAQRLMDSLWQAGIRPGMGDPLHVDITRAMQNLVNAKDDHIKDLRAIVMNRLALEIP